MMAVEVKAAAGNFQPSIPRGSFHARIASNPATFAVTHDGQRFLDTGGSGEEAAREDLTVMINWTPGIRR